MATAPSKQRFLLGWQLPRRGEDARFLKWSLANRAKAVLADPQAMGNYMTYRDAIRILGLDPAELYRDGRIDLDRREWSDLGWMCSHVGPPDSAVQAMRRETTPENVGPYSPDLIAPLRELAARVKFGRERGDDFEVIGVEGAQAGVGYSMLTFIDPGDEVIITDPGYFHFVPALTLAGGVPVRLPLGPHNGYRLDPDEVARALTPRTKMIVLCDPVNPFGTVQTRAELIALAELAWEHQVLILDDITHNSHQIDPTAAQWPLTALHDAVETRHVLITFGMSHGYALAAIRIGFLGGHPALMRAALATKIGTTRLNTNLVAQHGALAALEDGAYLEYSDAIVRRNYAHVRETVARTPGLTVPVAPQFGFSMVIDVSGTGITGQELTVALFKRRVAIYPGDGLGDVGATEYIRINLSQLESEAFERLRRALPEAIEEARTGCYRAAISDFFAQTGTARGQRIIERLQRGTLPRGAVAPAGSG